jgi:pSer/pThr/pTyr-binding forkhead associated (FHA) protein
MGSSDGDQNPWRQFIGRSRHSDVVLDDPTVSRVHAVVCRQNGRWAITDLDSVNGVVVNGARVKRAVLEPGDVILLGRVRLSFGRRLSAEVGRSIPTYGAVNTSAPNFPGSGVPA